MKNIAFFLSLCLIASISMAQSLERQVIGTAGDYVENGDISLSYTIGEPVIETAITGSIILTQGFQQPDASRTASGVAETGVEVNYNIYPNPATDMLNVQLTSNEKVDLIVELYDMGGKKNMLKTSKFSVEGTSTQQFDVAHLAAAQYMLVLNDVNGQTVRSLTFQKVD